MGDAWDADANVIRWRMDQALEHGLSVQEALEFAKSGNDLEELRQLIRKKGCDPHVAAAIVR